MQSNPQSPSLSSLSKLLDELEIILTREIPQENPWVSIGQLSDLFAHQMGVSLNAVAGCHCSCLRSQLVQSGRFAIYGTPDPQVFHVRLKRNPVEYPLPQTVPTACQGKQPHKGQSGLLQQLTVEAPQKPAPSASNPVKSRQRAAYRSRQVPKIHTVDDLEMALLEIIKDLMIQHPGKPVMVSTMSQVFHQFYNVPVQTVLLRVCPDMTLVELLQTIPTMQVHAMDGDWQVQAQADLLAPWRIM